MIDWRQFCPASRDFQLEPQGVVVVLDKSDEPRKHRVRVQVAENGIELQAMVALRGIVDGIDDVVLSAWERNRSATLVGFSRDDHGRLVGRSWVPLEGLTKDEFQFYVRTLAVACDLFEFQLTGQDRQ